MGNHHEQQAQDMLERVPTADRAGVHQFHYLLVGSVVHALLDVAAALRESQRTTSQD